MNVNSPVDNEKCTPLPSTPKTSDYDIGGKYYYDLFGSSSEIEEQTLETIDTVSETPTQRIFIDQFGHYFLPLWKQHYNCMDTPWKSSSKSIRNSTLPPRKKRVKRELFPPSPPTPTYFRNLKYRLVNLDTTMYTVQYKSNTVYLKSKRSQERSPSL